MTRGTSWARWTRSSRTTWWGCVLVSVGVKIGKRCVQGLGRCDKRRDKLILVCFDSHIYRTDILLRVHDSIRQGYSTSMDEETLYFSTSTPMRVSLRVKAGKVRRWNRSTDSYDMCPICTSTKRCIRWSAPCKPCQERLSTRIYDKGRGPAVLRDGISHRARVPRFHPLAKLNVSATRASTGVRALKTRPIGNIAGSEPGSATTLLFALSHEDHPSPSRISGTGPGPGPG